MVGTPSSSAMRGAERASKPSTWSPSTRRAVQRQAAAGKAGRAVEALKKEQAQKKEVSVPFKTGAPTKPSVPTPSVTKVSKRALTGTEFLRKYAGREPTLVERRAARFESKPSERISTGRAIGRGIVRGVKQAPAQVGESLTFLVPSVLKRGTGEFTEIGAKGAFREVTGEEKAAQVFGRQEGETAVEYGTRTAVGIGSSLVAFAGTTQPVVKGITPTTRVVSKVTTTPSGKIRGAGVIETVDDPLQVLFRAKAKGVKGITAVKGEAVVKVKPKLFETFKFKGLGRRTVEYFKPSKKFGGVIGEVKKATKVVGKKVIKVKPDTKSFIGEQVITKFKDTKSLVASKIDIFKGKLPKDIFTKVSSKKGLTKVGEVKEISFVKRVAEEFPKDIYSSKAPTVTKPTTLITDTKKIFKGTLETLAPKYAKLKTGLKLPSIPRGARTTAPRLSGAMISEDTRMSVMPSELIKPPVSPAFIEKDIIKGVPDTEMSIAPTYAIPSSKVSELEATRTRLTPITELKRKTKTDIMRPITTPLPVERTTITTTPITTPITTLKPPTTIAPPIPKTTTRLRPPTTTTLYPPFIVPTTTLIPTTAFPPFLPLPSIALPRGRAPRPISPSREFAYFPSLRALETRKRGKVPKFAGAVRLRPITEEFAGRASRIIGGF